MRWLVAQFQHETNTFSNILPGRKEFAEREFYRGTGIPRKMRGTRTCVGAFIDFLKAHRISPVWTVDAFATPAGPVKRDFYDWVTDRILAAVTDDIDAVLLALHGAMVVDGIDDGEGELLVALRDRLGPERPIATTLDYHTNLSRKMLDAADVLVGYKTYPHVDTYETGIKAAELLLRCVKGEITPVRHAEFPLILPPLGNTLTSGEPMRRVMDRARAMEGEPGVLGVSVFGGFPYADVPDAGMSVLVITDGERGGEDLAAELSGVLWERRQEFRHQAVPIAEAVKRAREASSGPVVLADVADNPGGGGANDGVEVLRELLKQDAQDAAVGMIWDVQAVKACHAADVGARVELDLGAKTDDLHGKPIALSGTVVHLGDGHFTYEGPMSKGVKACMGRTAVVKAGGVEVVIASRRFQNLDLAFFRSVGIEPTARRILVVKSSIHFRAAYGPIAKAIIEVDAPGLVSPNLSRFAFRHVRRPIFPLDDI